MAQEWDSTGRLQEGFSALVGSISQIVWLSEEGGRWTWSSSKWEAYTGLSDDMSRGQGWLAAIPAKEREEVAAAWQDAPLKGTLDVEHGLIRGADGETRWFRTQATPLSARPGYVREWIGTCTDVHEIRQAERREDLLHTEFRRRNLDVIALMRLILRQLPKTDGSVEDFALRLESRLDALARAQAIVSCRLGMTVDLEQIVMGEAMLHMAHESGQIQVTGPAIPLLGKAASTFGLIVHELMEASVIYGALSRPEGRVSIIWHVDSGDLLRFKWLETSLDTPDGLSLHYGSCRELIEHMLADEWGSAASLDVGQSGVQHTITLPLKAGVIGALPK